MVRSIDHRLAVKKIARDPLTRAIMWLVFNGIPFDVAYALTAIELEAWSIIFSEFNGSKRYSFDIDDWVDPGSEDDDG